MYLFLHASRREIENLLDLLNLYEVYSGQKVNLQKSAVAFSRSIPDEETTQFSQMLHIGFVGNFDSYLGLPTTIARKKKETFRFIEDKVTSRLKSWQSQSISPAGMEVLLSSVVSALPVYTMSCFRLPAHLTKRLNQLTAQFWWKKAIDTPGLHWLAWKKLCRPRSEGGLGFKNFESLNQALLGKQGWTLITRSDSLLTQIYKGRYFPNSSFLAAKKGGRLSWAWRGFLFGRTLLQDGLRWQVGNGAQINTVSDK
ncbi:Uncharacterized mitochondrial protein AtMg00310 [Linum perenne]